MGKLDGMDPKLVRELLAEVGRAGQQMRTVESRITQLTSGAGLSVPATHRPAQVADAGATLVRDVNARLVLLEKKEKQKDPATGPKSMKQTAPDKQGSKSQNDKSDKANKTDKHRTPTTNTQDKPHKQNPPHPDKTDKTDAPKSDHSDPSPKAEKPEKHGTPKGDKPDPAPKLEHPIKHDSPQADKPTTHQAPKADPTPKADPAPNADSSPKADPAPKGDQPQYVQPTGDVPQGGAGGQLDTPNVDNPNDIDTTQERTRVIEVDGVRVVEVTMKPPSAEHLHWLQQNMDKIPPMDQPVVVPPDGAKPGHPHADGPIGYIQPDDPSGSGKPSAPLPPDPGRPAGAQGLTAPQGAAQPGEYVQPGAYSPYDDGARYGYYSGDSQYPSGVESADGNAYAADTSDSGPSDGDYGPDDGDVPSDVSPAPGSPSGSNPASPSGS